MSKINAEWIKARADECSECLKDGFQWTDLFTMMPKVIEVVKNLQEMSEDERKGAAVEILNYIIDETDTPWVPDSVVDPVIKTAVPYIVDYAYSKFEQRLEEQE